MNQDIYFPIKSNIDFFEKKSNQPPLINKIKQSLLMYENLYFDAGGYDLSCSDRGSFSNVIPPNMVNEFEYEVPETPHKGFYAGIQPKPNGTPIITIPPNTNERNYRVSFQKLIEELGLQDEKFIKFHYIELNDEGKKQLSNVKWKNSDYEKYIDAPYFCKKKILENFFESIILSNDLKKPIMLDSFNAQLMSNFSYNTIKNDLRLEVLNTTLYKINDCFKESNLPDFSLMPVEELLDLRKDKEFRNFREKILEISTALKELNVDKLNDLISRELISEQNSLLQEIAPSREHFVLKIGFGLFSLIPGISEAISAGGLVIDTIEEYKKLHKYENSWLAFIFQYNG